MSPVQQFVDAVSSGSDAQEACNSFVSAVKELVDVAGISAVDLQTLLAAVKDKKVGANALVAFAAAVRGADLQVRAVPALPKVLECCGDKDKKVVAAAEDAANAVVETMEAWAVPSVAPMLIAAMGSKAKPSQKEVALKLILALPQKSQLATGRCLVKLIPAISDLMWDIKKEIKSAAIQAMTEVIKCTGNKDLDPFMPVVLKSITEPTSVPESVEELAGCVFVQNVEAPALAVLTPVLVRGLNDRSEAVRRKCCVIIDNMCKLVEEPKEVLALMPKLEPLMAKNKEAISDPEARSVCERAHVTLTKAGGEGKFEEVTVDAVKEIFVKSMASAPSAAGFEETLTYVSELATNLTNGFAFEADLWTSAIVNLLKKFMTEEEANKVCNAVLEQCAVAGKTQEEEYDDGDDGVDMYKGVFSLAYGSLTLLNNTKMHLKRNKFYGLLGPNNCGKTTLMRAIANEQVEGFPKRDELRTIFVEHEIAEREVGEDENRYPILNIDLSGMDWVVDTCNNVYEMQPPVTREQVAEVMEEIGFGNSENGTGKDRAACAAMGVTTYSGGWKMKMQLCAATLMNADILMLDEPTGHMDVKNIAWLRDWLNAFMDKGGSVIATSHDSDFLNKMCTHVLDFQDRKLRMFRGDRGSVLEKWVEEFPEKKGYFELKNDVVKFVFPKPGALEGVKSRTKAIMKMQDVSFQYPTRDTPTVFDIGLQVNQVSRVAVVGPNGAGKSTAIKLLNGELKPNVGNGVVWKHPSMRLAYVAQHAFQHLEKHYRSTAVEYIMWRFAGNDDKESVEFKTNTPLSNEEASLQEQQWFLDPKQSYRLRKCETKEELKQAVVPESLMKRRELKKEKTKEYEVKWQFKSIEAMNWVDRDTLIKMGYLKMVQRKDEQEAAAAGLMSKPLTTQAIEKHLKDFGIDAEQASHTQIQALSGGQKVKVVLAASMWQNPHLLILDEPTNYLDRDGLGALTKAIDDYEGGVIIISHNREFANAVSQEKWVMEAGRLRREGESVLQGEENQDGNAEQEEVRDAFGNTIKVCIKKTETDKDKKSELKRIEKKLKDHKKKKPELDEEEMWELMDRQEVLKAELAK